MPVNLRNWCRGNKPPKGGCVDKSKILFVDWRDILCGRLEWRTAEGARLGVANPPEPPVPVHAHPYRVPHGIRLEAQPATTEGPVGWKGWGRIIRDGGNYRSWHFEINGHSKLGSGSAAHTGQPDSVFICGVESADGFEWREVSRCRIQVASQRGFDGVGFFIDPVAPPEERYKLVYCATFPEGAHDDMVRAYLERPARHRDERISWERRYGLFCAVSADGESWTSVNKPFALHPSDTDTTVLWEEHLGKYVMYTRMFENARRWIGRAEAVDFREWSPVAPVVWPGPAAPPDRDYYLNGYSRYPGLAEYQLMFPMVYQRFTERSDIHLFSSGDGVSWSEVPGGPVIRPGAPDAWDSEFLGSGKDLMPFGPDRVAIPYSGTSFPHKYPRFQSVWDSFDMGWASWQRDRICAVVADGEGEFWTQPVLPAAGRIRLNYRAPTAGVIHVGIEGVDGRSAADCDPLTGDQIDRVVTWGGAADPLTEVQGKPVTLHIRMRCAELFCLDLS